jgi:hypothetical protein
MTAIAPRWLLSAQGLLAAGDSHAAAGYHFRIHASALLGLPIAPFTVYRLGFDRPDFRSDVIWIDSRGSLLQPPFEVRGDNPVHGYLPSPDEGVCGWFQIKGTLRGGLGVPAVPVPAKRRPADRKASGRAAARGRTNTASDRATAPLPALKLEAQVLTPRGWASVASRSKAPWVVTATSIERVQVTGNGQVDEARWIDLLRLPAESDNAIAHLALPVEQGRRYKGVANAYDYARGQATRAASIRRALQEAPGAADPSAAPAWSAEQEGRRLDALDADLVIDTQTLVDDTARQCDVRRTYAITQNGSTLPGDGLSQPVLAGVLSAMQDPAVARLMGFMTWDDDPPMAVDSKKLPLGLVYRVYGFWEVEERDGEYGVVQSLSAADQIEFGRSDIFWALPSDADVYADRNALEERLAFHRLEPPVGLLGPVAELQTAVVTLADDPMSDTPAPPHIASIGPANPPWLPGTAPAARRCIDLDVDGLGAGAGLAMARRSDAAPLWVSLNPRTGLHHSLIVPAAPPDANAPGAGEVSDRNAPPIACAYRVAQSDAFGRWSHWSTADVAEGLRPAPPQPVIEASFTPAALPDPMHEAPLAGQIRVSVAVPAPKDLPPGAYLLDRVRILFDGVEVATAPPGSGTTVVGSRSAPALTPASRTDVVVGAIWVDTAGQSSAPSNTVRVNCYDLRSPPPVVLANGLQYASRRDATGRCRAEVTWPVIPGQRYFRVYVTNETTLRTHLEALAASGDTSARDLLTTLDAMTAPDRAALLRAEKPRFPRNLFELVTDRPIEAAGTARFEHALSASLSVLAFYRVVAVAETNVEAPFAESDLLAVAVPNSPAPRAPSLELASVDVPVANGLALGIRVRITVPPGLTGASEYRLFRSTEETRDVGRMPLVASGTLPAAAAGRAQLHTVLLVGDEAPGLPDPAVVGPYDEVISADIRLWMRYHFRADVRGGPEPGSGAAGTREVPGIWSSAAPPVSLLVVTGESPVAATDLVFRARSKTLLWQHPDPLRGRHAGNYVFDVYRTLPGEREALFASIKADAAFDQGGRKPDGSGSYHIADPDAAGGVRYRIVLGDPLGRPSLFVEITV